MKLVVLFALASLLSSCGSSQAGPSYLVVPADVLAARQEHDAEKVQVQHILISYAGFSPRVQATRTREEAAAFVAELLERIDQGEDFGELMREHSQDPGPGIYVMTTGPTVPGVETNRAGMATSFGDVGWKLQVGEVGVADPDPVKSPFGWHIIKRLS